MDKWSQWRAPVCLGLSVIACGLSVALWRRGRTGAGLPGCGGGSGCESVLASRWSRVGGVPAAAMGSLVYAVVAGALVSSLLGPRGEVLGHLIAGLITLAAGAAAWFTFLQVVILRRICPYCTAVHLIGLMLAVAWWVGPPEARTFSPTAIAAGTVGVFGLIAAQLTIRPKLHRVLAFESLDSLTTAAAVPVAAPTPRGGDAHRPASADAPGARRILLLGGRVILDHGAWPRLGPVDAERVIGCLFDYTCPTCRRVHRTVSEAVERANGRLAVLLLPVPMDPKCNPHVTRMHALNAHACRFARLGMLLWQAAPGAYAAYDEWAFVGDEPPPLGLAVMKAREVSGVADLEAETPDPAADGPVNEALAIYRSSEIGRIPALLFEFQAVLGEVASPEVILRTANVSVAVGPRPIV